MSEPETLDIETRAHSDHHDALRLWLRLLSASTRMENEIRSRLRERFATTLPRFDLMAQLERHPRGLKMNELSRRLMVSNGNVTGITDQLVAEGLVERHAPPDDRRSFLVRLTARGRASFAHMATEHEAWVVELMGNLTERDMAQLHRLLGKLKDGMATDTAQPKPSEPT
jgi:DNA-binding MarR family transcriptional regulator